MMSVHINSGLVLHQMTSDHNRSELRIQDHRNESSSSKLVPKVVPLAVKTATSRQELELLFHHHIAMLRTTERRLVDEPSVKGVITGGVRRFTADTWIRSGSLRPSEKDQALRVNHFIISLKAINPSLCIMIQSIPRISECNRREFADAVNATNKFVFLKYQLNVEDRILLQLL
ncbi:hypothetical protein Tco_0327701 [Tanacetum coccineum]